MYEQISHSLLNEILDEIKPEIRQRRNLRHFYTRLGANFYAIYSLLYRLYGARPDFKAATIRLVEVMAIRYIERSSELEARDMSREANHNWFVTEQWVGMALYADGFAGDLTKVAEKLPYLQELGVNLLHIMPMLVCPEGESDGGYAVSDFRNIAQRIGSLEMLAALTESLRKRDMLLTLDVVVNHTSNQHEWARKARAGDERYRDYYYTYPDREIPDLFEQSMPEVFPESSPGNFTWDEQLGRWVMTVFHNYQWDLNYTNPAVFIEMVDVILFWANHGADIIRLDAVAFLWKKIGTSCQNEREAHLILQLMKDCCQVTAPGVLFIAEAIVAPSEIIKYFGEDAIAAKECEIAYNATLMALLWDGIATHNAKLLNRGLQSLPDKLDRATWLNYVRCHDDIGLGFDDTDIRRVGYEPRAHRQFLVDYFTGQYEHSEARGVVFGRNAKTGDARIAGALASLVGLEWAIEHNDERAVERCVRQILLLHSVIMSFGGIPLLYYGDEIGTTNDHSWKTDPFKSNDSRWLHRPRIDWRRAERRHERGTVEERIFSGIKRLIGVRKAVPAFGDFNNRTLIAVDNEHLLVFRRTPPTQSGAGVVVFSNFDAEPQLVNLLDERAHIAIDGGLASDLITGQRPELHDDVLTVPAFGYCWLTESR